VKVFHSLYESVSQMMSKTLPAGVEMAIVEPDVKTMLLEGMLGVDWGCDQDVMFG
jgi:hypothetical protein